MNMPTPTSGGKPITADRYRKYAVREASGLSRLTTGVPLALPVLCKLFENMGLHWRSQWHTALIFNCPRPLVDSQIPFDAARLGGGEEISERVGIVFNRAIPPRIDPDFANPAFLLLIIEMV